MRACGREACRVVLLLIQSLANHSHAHMHRSLGAYIALHPGVCSGYAEGKPWAHRAIPSR